jgi:hypothetical protein
MPPQCGWDRGSIESAAMDNPTFSLSASEKQTLRYVAEGEFHSRELDWLAVQRLKQTGLLEERSTGPQMTAESRRALQRLLSSCT